MFNFDVYTDMAGNVRASLPSHVAHYTVMFLESGLVSTVSEHETVTPQRGDISVWLPDSKILNITQMYI